MTYEIDSSELLVQIDRSKILDITVGDTIAVSELSKAEYVWTEHDQQLLETNPDAELILKVARKQDGKAYQATGLIVRERS